MSRPTLSRVPEFYHGYINKVSEDDLMTAMKRQTKEFGRFLRDLPAEKREYRYAEGKWTIKEVLQHIVDAERIFAYRALCFARKDATPLPSFDENAYAENAKADQRRWDDLVEEFESLRKANELMFGSFDEEQMESTGTASGKPNYVSAIGFTIVGHLQHHVDVMKERYLS